MGKESDDVHKKLFSKIENVCDVAYIVSQKSIKLKVYKVNENNCKFVFEKDFDKVAVMIRKKIKYGDADTKELQSGDWNQQRKTVVLFESRGAGVVMKKIL